MNPQDLTRLIACFSEEGEVYAHFRGQTFTIGGHIDYMTSKGGVAAGPVLFLIPFDKEHTIGHTDERTFATYGKEK